MGSGVLDIKVERSVMQEHGSQQPRAGLQEAGWVYLLESSGGLVTTLTLHHLGLTARGGGGSGTLGNSIRIRNKEKLPFYKMSATFSFSTKRWESPVPREHIITPELMFSP